jgi:hypothetical protein
MELSTKLPSGEYLKPVIKKNEADLELSDRSNDENESQKELFDDYVKNISEYEEKMEEKSNDKVVIIENKSTIKKQTPRKKMYVAFKIQ